MLSKPERALKSYFSIYRSSFGLPRGPVTLSRLGSRAGPILALTRITPNLFLDLRFGYVMLVRLRGSTLLFYNVPLTYRAISHNLSFGNSKDSVKKGRRKFSLIIRGMICHFEKFEKG
jgi:hypothetical protein